MGPIMLSIRPANSSNSETNKRNTLLQAIHRKGATSRLQLARELHISNSRVCDLIEQMVEEKLLQEQAVAGDRRGRRGVGVRTNPSFGHLIGFDMEAKRLRLVVTDFSGNVVWQTRRAMKSVKDRDALIEEVQSFVDGAMKEIRPRFTNLLGVGLAASGVIDSRRGMIVHYDVVPQAINVPIRDILAERTGLPCVMENNIRAMTLAEWTTGAAKGLKSFICFAVRSGVGAGVVLNGRLLTGSHNVCGEVGYMVVPTGNGATHWKHLQEVVSESALDIDIEAKGFEFTETQARRVGEIIGSQLASIAVVIDPEAIVLAGGMLSQDGPVWSHVIDTFRKAALSEVVDRMRILPAQLGPFAAALGAAHRCLYELFPVAQAMA
jgi:predicted NBD/HSP70 family sugar kinase